MIQRKTENHELYLALILGLTLTLLLGLLFFYRVCFRQKEPLVSEISLTKTGVLEKNVLPQSGERAPDFILLNANNQRVQLSSFLGKPIVLVFFASWCRDCIKNIEFVQEQAKNFPQIEFLKIHLAWTENKKLVTDSSDFLQNQNLLLLLDETGEVFNIYNHYQKNLPLFYLIDAKGKVIKKSSSLLTLEDLKQLEQ